MVIDAGADERRCIACGFVEARPDPGVSVPPTRVTRAAGAARRDRSRSGPLAGGLGVGTALHNLKLCGELIKSISIHIPVRRPYGSLIGRDPLPMLFSANSL